jgi:hypothetical protein
LADEAFGYLPAEHLVAGTVRRNFFFAISLAVPQPFLSPPDAHLPQFAQKAGTPAARKWLRSISIGGWWRLRGFGGAEIRHQIIADVNHHGRDQGVVFDLIDGNVAQLSIVKNCAGDRALVFLRCDRQG